MGGDYDLEVTMELVAAGALFVLIMTLSLDSARRMRRSVPATQRRKFMSIRSVISLVAVAALGIAFVATDAFAARVAARGGAVGVRGGAIARGGAVGVRTGALGYRGGLYGRGYYRPGLGLAAGAVVGGAIAASQPWNGYGGYGGYGYGYDSGYGYAGPAAAAYAPAGSYDNYGYVPGTGFNPYTHAGYGYNPAYRYGSDPSSSYAYAGECTSDPISCSGQCWLNDNGSHYRWGDCPAANKHH